MKKLLLAAALVLVMASGSFAQRFTSPFNPMVNANSPWWFNPNNIYYTPVPAPGSATVDGQQFNNSGSGFYNPYYTPYYGPSSSGPYDVP